MSEQIADINTMDVDVSCSHYSDNELPTDVAGMYSADNSSICENGDSVTTDASSNKDGVGVTNDIETGPSTCSLLQHLVREAS